MTGTLLKKLVGVAGAFVLASVVSTAPASAAIFTFDNTGLAMGNVSYDGEGGPAAGTGITFDRFTASGTGATDGIYVCQGCVLNFTTGANTGLEGPPSWQWDGGGSFTITGTVVGTGASGVLLTGTFTGAGAFDFGDVDPMLPLTLSGTGTDTKNADLLAFFGLSGDGFVFATTNITMETCAAADNGGFDCTVAEADVTNTGGDEVVPEPGSLMLLGLGLLGFGAAARRRARK